MPDVYADITTADDATVERIAGVLETRGADPQQQAMRQEFLRGVAFPKGARVLEVGCGTGVLTRVLSSWPGVASVVGVDPSPGLLERAAELSKACANVEFRVGDGRELPFGDGEFDAVVFDSTLSHVPGAERAVADAFRVMKAGGVFAAFDGDYATTTVALGPHDPLQTCVDAMMAASVTDRHVMRKVSGMLTAAGFVADALQGYSYNDTAGGGYMLSVIDRGCDILHADGVIDAVTAAALKEQARRRVAAGAFFGHIAYASITARKP